MRHRLLFILSCFFFSFLWATDAPLAGNGAKPPNNFMKELETVNDPRFILVTHFDLNVPRSYSHEEQLAKFRFENGVRFTKFSNALTDETWANAVQKLKPGKVYEVRIFSFAEEVSYADCKQFCESKGAFLAGAQGLSLIWELKKERLPLDKALISFNDLDAYTNTKERIHLLPFIARFSNGSWWLEIIQVKGRMNSDYCLVCFFEKRP